MTENTAFILAYVGAFSTMMPLLVLLYNLLREREQKEEMLILNMFVCMVAFMQVLFMFLVFMKINTLVLMRYIFPVHGFFLIMLFAVWGNWVKAGHWNLKKIMGIGFSMWFAMKLTHDFAPEFVKSEFDYPYYLFIAEGAILAPFAVISLWKSRGFKAIVMWAILIYLVATAIDMVFFPIDWIWAYAGLGIINIVTYILLAVGVGKSFSKNGGMR